MFLYKKFKFYLEDIMKKFLIIPILIVAYIYFVIFILSQVSFLTPKTESATGPPGAQVIGIGESISVSVTRPYLFGLIRLPIYTSQFGDIGLYHELFFYFIIILTVSFIIQEIKYKKKRKGAKMVKKVNWTKYVMPIVWGIVFALIAYILSGDDSSIVVGLLVMYLEYKLRK